MILPYYNLSNYIFASFTDYKGDIFEVISNLHVQGSKFAEKLTNLAENLKKKLNSKSAVQDCFPGI